MPLVETVRSVDAAVAAHDANMESFAECEDLMKGLGSNIAKGWARMEFRRLSALRDVAQFTYDLERLRTRARKTRKQLKSVHSLLEDGYGTLAEFSAIITEYRLPAIMIGGETAEKWREIAKLAHDAANSVAEELRTDPKFLLRLLTARRPSFRN